MFFFGRTRNEIQEAVTTYDDVTQHLRVLGLTNDASWDDICDAHQRLVADLTPSVGAAHQNVALAESFLREVNEAFSSLQIRSVA
jgi:curved DNA-binding protein CbpA